jgi:hypothetical protein
MPKVFPVQAIIRGGSTRRSVEVTGPGPAFQRKIEPVATAPCIDIDFTSRFQLGRRSNAVSTSQTASGAAAISISLVPTIGARSLIPASDVPTEASLIGSGMSPSYPTNSAHPTAERQARPACAKNRDAAVNQFAVRSDAVPPENDTAQARA